MFLIYTNPLPHFLLRQVDGSIVSQIGPGLLVLVGIRDTDVEADAELLCRKLLTARLFSDPATGRAWDKSVVDTGLDVLSISQFTLYGHLKKPRPDFHYAMPPQQVILWGKLLSPCHCIYGGWLFTRCRPPPHYTIACPRTSLRRHARSTTRSWAG